MEVANSQEIEPVRLKRAPIPIGAGRRKHKRVAITLLGRFMRPDKNEYPCRTLDISVGGIAIFSPVIPTLGETIVAYFDSIGGLQGTVVRIFEEGFAIKLNVSRHKQEKLAAELTWLINRESFGTIDERRHERQTPSNEFTALTLNDEFATKCKILDISLSGASIATQARPPIGSEVKLGLQHAIVRRHHEVGIGIQFLEADQSEAPSESKS